MELDLTNSELFKSFTEFDTGDLHVDLHNEFECSAVKFSYSTKELVLSFKANEFNTREFSTIHIHFRDCIIALFGLEVSSTENPTIDMIYRGRFEKDGQLHEISEEGLFYYYLDFCDGFSFELFAKEVKALIGN